MTLVTHARYVAITGDATTSAGEVAERIAEATELLAAELDRPIEHGTHTEQAWPNRYGWVTPHATPITDAAGMTVAGGQLRPASWPTCPGPIEITYAGGWVERTAHPDATNRLPIQLERDLAAVAYVLGHRDQLVASLPRGATAAAVGDVSVAFTAGATTGSVDDMRIRWSRSTLRWRYRSVP